MNKVKALIRWTVMGAVAWGSLSILVYAQGVVPSVQPATMVLQFESPFPATPLKVVLDSCMQLFAEVEYQHVAQQGACIEQKLTILDTHVTGLFAQQGVRAGQDVEYLLELVQHIEGIYHKKISHSALPYASTAPSRALFAGIKGKLAHFIVLG